ncbi:MAG: TIGR03617 family F420-dependent LLM class oxidoreductase [Deltaproteobacteria bacterium]|nr:TIGR03617 family F420-dependent LLM class oxidoreductase [Deltaproteobacteria bacterium]
MEVVASMGPDFRLGDVAAYARRVESLGYDGLSVPEAKHEGTLAAFAALGATSRIRVNTGVLVAFARSPMLAAQAAWDLQDFSDGRFVLGLGSQVKGNVTGRFGMPWSAPAARMRDYVGAVRACFETFQNGTPLNFESESYTLNRMQPFFNPGPLECGPPPILMGAVGPIMTRTVGTVGDMLQTHPTNSEARFVREVTRPRLEEGRKRSALEEPVKLLAGPLVATGRDQVAVDAALKSARETLVFTLSTPAYWPVLEYHGWLEVGHRLRDLTRAGAWGEMDAAVSDEMIDTLVVSGTYEVIAERILAQYAGLAEGVLFPVAPDSENDDAARKAIEEIREGDTP